LTIYSHYRRYATMNIKGMQVDPDQMAAAADQASELLKSLGNRHRLLILCQLTEGERSVGDLASFLRLRDSTVSQHLSLLRRDGLVQARRDGQTIWYSIASPPARRVLQTLFEIFCKPESMCETPVRRRVTRSSSSRSSKEP
jgi:ArsR family transcriptional regulator, virulence genes transcriptional regulator